MRLKPVNDKIVVKPSEKNDEDILSKVTWKQKDVTITEVYQGGEE